jgi:hypothetical protein
MESTQINYENEATTQERIAHEHNNAEPEKKLSELKSFEPLYDRDGQHRSNNGPFGLIYFFQVTMENGDTGSVGSKKQVPSWQIGEEYEYSVHVNGSYTNLRGFKKYGTHPFVTKFGSPNKTMMAQSNAQTALNAAVAYGCARLQNGIEFKAAHCLKLAEKFHTFLQEKS